MKKWIVLLLALCLAAALGWAFAEETVVKGNFTYTITDGEAALTRIEGDYSNDYLTIPSSVEKDGVTYPVTAIGANIYSHKSIRALLMPDSIKTIGSGAFAYTYIQSMYWSKSLEVIGSSAFEYNTALTNSRLPALPDSVRYVGNYAFYGASFFNNTALPAGLTHIGDYAFSQCHYLRENLTLPENLETLGEYAFSGCSNLKSVTIPDGISVVPRFAFSNCQYLTTVSLPDSVTEIGDSAFFNCIALKEVRLPSDLTTLGASAFKQCSSLAEIHLPDSLTTMGEFAFIQCTSLKRAILPYWFSDIPKSAFAYFSSLRQVRMPRNLRSVGASAFYGCDALKTIELTNWSTTIGSYALPDGVTAIVEDDSRPLDYCKSYRINYITTGEISWEVIDDSANTCAFTGYTGSAEAFSVPESLYGYTIVRLGNGAFSNRYAAGTLKSVTLPDTITEIGSNAFKGCTALETIELPAGITAIGESAFMGCTGLKSFAIPEGIATISARLLSGCTALENITLPECVTAIGTYAFYNCAALSNIELPSGLQTIGAYAFYNCASLSGQWSFSDTVTLGSGALPSGTGLIMIVGYGTPAYSYALTDGIDYRVHPCAIDRITANQKDLEVVYGKSAQLEFTLEPNIDPTKFLENPFVYASTDESVATVSATGLVKSVSPGTATITISCKDDVFVNDTVNIAVVDRRETTSLPAAFVAVSSGSNYAKAVYGVSGGVAPYTITLRAGYNTDTYTKTYRNVYAPEGRVSFTYRTTVAPETEKTIYYYVDVTDAAGKTSSTSGSFKRSYSSTRVGVGEPHPTGNVVMGPDGNYHYEMVYDSYQTITTWHDTCISGEATTNQIRQISVADIGGRPGESARLNVLVAPVNLSNKVVYFSDDPSIASVDEDGTVHFNALGQTTVRAYTIDGSGLCATATVSCLNQQIELIELAPGDVNREDCTQPITPYIEPADADFQQLHWSTDDPEIASIDENGVLTWHTAGEVRVTATAMDGSGVSMEIPISWEGILVEKLTLLISEDDPKHLVWLVEPENATNPAVEFRVDKPTLLLVDEAGYMTFLDEGYAHVQARALDGSGVTTTLEVWTHEHTEIVEPGTPATCTEDGVTDRIYCETCQTVLQEHEVIPMLGHDWGEPTFTWSDSCGSVVAERVCQRDASHTETETVQTTSEITKPATCGAMGETTYTAQFENDAFGVQTKTLANIRALAHNRVIAALPTADHYPGIACLRCGAMLVPEAELDESRNLVLPESLTEIAPEAFAGDTDLQTVTLPASVTKIGERAFESCTGLRLVYIGMNVEEIAEDAFDGCDKLILVIDGDNFYALEYAEVYDIPYSFGDFPAPEIPLPQD